MTDDEKVKKEEMPKSVSLLDTIMAHIRKSLGGESTEEMLKRKRGKELDEYF